MLYRYVGKSISGLPNGTYVYKQDDKLLVVETSKENLRLFKTFDIKVCKESSIYDACAEINDGYALNKFIQSIITRQNFINKKVKQLI